MRKLLRVFYVLTGIFLVVYTPSWATHLRAGEITVSRMSCTSLTFRITVTVYIDTESGIQLGGPGEILNFGDSSFVEVPETSTIARPDLGEKMGIASYSILHTYAGPGTYIIRYTEPNRNESVLNVTNSVQTLFYLETKILIDPVMGCNNSPKLRVPPIDAACTGAMWVHNPSAYDPDGDSLSYELSVPKRGKGTAVNGYRDPNDQIFYDRIGIDYGTANEAGTDQPTFKINPRTGTIRWDAPGAPGEYNIAFLIVEWRKSNGVWIRQGHVVRDMQIIVDDCMNRRPELEVPNEICVEAGEEVTQEIFGWDPDGDSVMIVAYSEVFEVNPNPARIEPIEKFQPSSPTNKARVTFSWQTDCLHVRTQPYQVTFKITDKPKQGARLVQFETWNIRVVAPAPKWKSAQVDLANRSAQLSWENYECGNAVKMQVWRRIDQFAFDPPECVTGMPDFLGFTKITETNMSTTNLVDNNNGKGLAVGAQYCYRLVAVFPLPDGSESYLSQDICLEPILADAPVITNVTVAKTAEKEGAITIRWQPPFDLNKTQFPPPYRYEVYRAEGFTGNVRLTPNPIHPGRLSDTSFVDTGLNTENVIYNYRIVLYDGNETRVDTSFTASSVRLEAKPQVNKIELTWNADVPWSNNTQDYPVHLVYRGKENMPESEFELVASVNVGQYKYHYVDSGQYNNIPINATDVYCYRVMTQGAYGNPKIEEPLKNFSQRICVQPNDQDPPCQPVIVAKGLSCEEYTQQTACGSGTFSNTLRWNKPDDEACRNDIRYYRIYMSSRAGGEFFLYKDLVYDTVFIDNNLSSFARCYKVSAMDRSGNESELSEAFCFDNCPYYELPNVFTPNGDECNERFSAYGDPDRSRSCGAVEDPSKCARFVLDVDFVVYNRWGTEVYKMPSGKDKNIYIRWNGRDNEGRELSSGLYYYKASVLFNTVDPQQQRKEIKGWVNLLRTSTPH